MLLLSGLRTITVPPHILPFEFEEAVNSGDMVIVNCAVTKGDVPLRITWTINGKLVKDYDGILIDTKKRVSQLTIDSVDGIHAGKYVCTATNAAGSYSFSAELNVNGTILYCAC